MARFSDLGRVDLKVVDLNAQCIVAQLKSGLRVHSGAAANPFNRFMSVGCDYQALRILDREMREVQSLTTDLFMRNPCMIDEYTIAALEFNKGIVLFDIRSLRRDNYQILIDSVDDQAKYALDVRNRRMLVPYGPYGILVQIDLQTWQWERVQIPFCDEYEGIHDAHGVVPPLINNKYMVMGRHGDCQTWLWADDYSA